MAQYKINILSSKKFDNLPTSVTKGSRIDDSLGFADPSTGEAYVRFTAIPELDQFLVNHELEELTASESSHEDENGIRHKKFFKDIFLPAITFGAVKSQAPQRRAAQTQSRDPSLTNFAGSPPTAFDPRAGGGPLGQFGGQGGEVGLTGGGGANVAGRLGSGLNQGGINVAQTALDSIRRKQQFGDFAGRAGLRF